MRADRQGEQGFTEFVAARQRALTRTAYLLTGDHHLAEDLLQTALLQAARHWERIEGHPEAYVRRILYHQNISWWRRRRFSERSLGDQDARPAGSPDTALRLTLADALGRLTTKQRTVLVLRFYEDLRRAGDLPGHGEVHDTPGTGPAPRAGAGARRPGGSR